MDFREIRVGGEVFEYTRSIWDAERSHPRWYADSVDAWLDGFEDFEKFVTRCIAIYGVFENKKLVGCVYFEEATEDGILLVHLSVIDKVDTDAFVEKCCQIRDIMLHQGVRSIRGWVVKRNVGLLKMLERVGFIPVGFFMDHGMSRGRLIRWTMIEIKR